VNHAGEQLSAWLDGELSGSEIDGVSAHLDACSSCRGELDDLVLARSAVRSLPLLELPGELLPASEVLPIRRRRLAWVGAAAAAVLTAIVGASVLTAPEPVVFDAGELQAVFVARSAVDASFRPAKAALIPAGLEGEQP
jgi:predicted anti-sigma-YlaC factor YlaD